MSQFETSAGYLGYPFENGASKMAVSVRFLCHLPNEEMAIHFSSTISSLIVERISQVASTGGALPLYLAGDGTVYGLSFVAAAAGPGGGAADGCSCDLEYRLARGRRHRSVALASEGGKPRQGHRLSCGGLWHFPLGRTSDLDWYAPSSSPLPSHLSSRQAILQRYGIST